MNKLILSFAFIMIALVACDKGKSATNSVAKATNNFSKVTVDTDSESEKFSYSLGMIIANTLKNNAIDSIDYSVVNKAFDDSENNQIAYTLTSQQVQSLVGEEIEMANVDKDIIKRAMYDVLEGDTTLLTLPEVNTAYRTFLQNSQIKVGEKNLTAGKSYLEGNLAKDGVKVTETGLQYQLIEEGAGDQPSGNDVLEVDFIGKTIGGEEFMSTQEGQPAYVDLSDPQSEIEGLMEGLKLYPAGSSFRLFIPSNLAFGANRMSPEVGPNSTVVFEILGSSIMDAEKKEQYREAKKQYQAQMEQMQRQQQQQQGR